MPNSRHRSEMDSSPAAQRSMNRRRSNGGLVFFQGNAFSSWDCRSNPMMRYPSDKSIVTYVASLYPGKMFMRRAWFVASRVGVGDDSPRRAPPGGHKGAPLRGEGAHEGSPLRGEGGHKGSPLRGEGAHEGSPLRGEGAHKGAPLRGEGAHEGLLLRGEGAAAEGWRVRDVRTVHAARDRPCGVAVLRGRLGWG